MRISQALLYYCIALITRGTYKSANLLLSLHKEALAVGSLFLNQGVCVSPEPEYSFPVPEQAPEGQLFVRGEQEGQPGERVHRGGVQQGGGKGDLREPPRDGKGTPRLDQMLLHLHDMSDFETNRK